MTHHTYLIVGGGMTAAAAVAGIREVEGEGSIGLISAEDRPPYDRPPLSKKLWTGKKKVADLWRPLDGVATYLGLTVQSLDLQAKTVTDEEGSTYGFDKLLLATGGTPRRLPFGGDRVLYFRTLDDYERLRELASRHQSFAVIGGGFIGSEIAAALAMNDRQVTMLFPEAGICARLFPPEVVEFLNGVYRERGVEVLPGESVTAVEGEGTDLTVVTASGRRLAANAVVAGIGIVPNVELAAAAGLATDNGIVVDASMRTSHPDVYAAGDVANFEDALLGVRRRVEHEDNANDMGKAAGRAMAGAEVAYDHSPMFYSDLFDLGYEAVGELDARLETVVDWQEPYEKGVLYYLADRRVRGVLLWNVWDHLDAARALIAEPGPFEAGDLAGRIR